MEAAGVIATELRVQQGPEAVPDQQRDAETSEWPATAAETPVDVPPPDKVLLPELKPDPAPAPPEPELAQPEGRLGQPPRETRAKLLRAPRRSDSQPLKAPKAKAAESSPPATRAGRTGDPDLLFDKPEVPPRLVEPPWPRAIRKRFSGSVLVEVVVRPDGVAAKADILEGTGRQDWDFELLRVFLKAAYIPGTVKGFPVACRHRFRVTFRQE